MIQIDSTLMVTAGSFLASMVLDKGLDLALEQSGKQLLGFIKKAVVPSPEAAGEVALLTEIIPEPEIYEEAVRFFDQSPVLRRIRLVAPALGPAKLLWVDDNPANNYYERMIFKSLSIGVDVARSTDGALALMENYPYQLVVSDMVRAEGFDAGLRLLGQLRAQNQPAPLIFYIGSVDRSLPTPAGAFGICSRPDDLTHLVLDVLERTSLM